MNEGRAKLPADPMPKLADTQNTISMTRSTILLVLVSAMPSYVSMFQPSWGAIAILALGTFIGFGLTASALSEFDSPEVREKTRLAWIIHTIGMMLVYTVHQF